jgi:energy-coupling factor transporter transmembrane protein EcfT
MIQVLSRIDLYANAGRTPWHRASAIAKLILAAALVLLAVFAPGLRLLVALHALAWVLALSSRLPAPLVIGAAGYPLAFSLLFVVARWDGTWATPALLLLRPLTASLAAVWLVGTTPYPDLFAPLSRLLPRAIADGLFLTYRALFELIARLERLLRALRLRGGGEGPARRRLTVAGEGLGTLVLYGFERGQRLSATMALRGHSGRICGCRHWAKTSASDALVAAAGAVAAAAAIVLWRRG